MALAASPFFQDHSFDQFLFADIGEESNGMVLSVLSGLARLDLDPWFEAASLSRLPAPAAMQRLTSLLSSLPGAHIEIPPPAAIRRLVGLLPQGGRDAPQPVDATFAPKSRMAGPALGLIVAVIAMLVAQQYMAKPDFNRSGVASPAASATGPGALKARGK